MQPPSETYSDKRLGLAIAYPSSWEIDARDPSFIQLTPSFGGRVLIQGILTGPTSGATQLSQVIKDVSDLPDFKELSRSPACGDPAGTMASIQWTVEGAPQRADFILTVRGARIFFVWATAPKGLFDQRRIDFEAVLGSFKITLPSGTEPVDSGAEVGELLDSITARVIRLRGLPEVPELGREFQTNEDFRRTAETELLDEETRAEIGVLKDFCLIMDLCEEEDDLVQAQLDLLLQGVLGLYDSEKKALVVVSEREERDPLSWLTFAHEYTHALQDSEFDLSELHSRAASFDSSKALSALVEGDARLAEYLFYESLPPDQQTLLAASLQRKIRTFSTSREVALAPPIITETFAWEHGAGPPFVLRLYLKGGFEAVNEAFDNPPRSTEQVLHPEKYLAGESPHVVELPDLASALGDGWQLRDSDVLGEMLTGVYLGTFLPKEEKADPAAKGWGGDLYVLLKDEAGRLLIAMLFSWDTAADADEFFEAYLDFAHQKSEGSWELENEDENFRLWTGDGISLVLARGGTGTLVAIGPDLSTVQTALAEISKTII